MENMFGVMGFTFGIFGLVALAKVIQLEKKLKDTRALE